MFRAEDWVEEYYNTIMFRAEDWVEESTGERGLQRVQDQHA